MLPLGLSARAQRALIHTLSWDHSIRVTVHVLDLDHRHVDDVSGTLMDGQVDWSTEGRFTSSVASLSLWDPAHAMQFDTRAPQAGQLFADRMLQVTYGVYVWGGVGWVDVPVFTGPVVAARRDGPTLAVECVGKERLASRPAWQVRTYPKGILKRDMIVKMIGSLTGERTSWMEIPDWTQRMPAQQVVGKYEDVWARATRVAETMGLQLFYDGRGVLRLRKPSDNVVFTFRDESTATPEAGPFVKSEPQAQFDVDDIVNVVAVTGAPQSNGKPPPNWTAVPPRDHPLNPHNLGRGGVQRILPEVIDDDEIRSTAEARALAEQKMAAHLREYVHVTFDSLPVPFLEPSDMCAVQAARTTVPTFRLHEFSLPLSGEAAMSVGTRRRVMGQTRRRWR